LQILRGHAEKTGLLVSETILVMPQKLLISILFICHLSYSQEPYSPSFFTLSVPGEAGEEIALETDRSFYCAGESLYFTARYESSFFREGIQWSNVLYVELIRWNGEKIVQAKIKIHKDIASGSLTIPGTILSGNYYLRAYTRWMRNYPQEKYTSVSVKIINPFNTDIDHGPTEESVKGHPKEEARTVSPIRGIHCKTDTYRYSQREQVELTLQNISGYEDLDLCLSVVKTAYIDTSGRYEQPQDPFIPEASELTFLPETRGLSISGKILNDPSTGASAHTRVHLSIPQDGKYFSSFDVQDNGRFHFTLPDFRGSNDFYLDAVLNNGDPSDLVIDNDYCNRGIQLRYVPFSLDSLEKEIALEMAVNMQLAGVYNDERKARTTDSVPLPFYIRSDQVYYTSDYIQLPNLEEFFFELVKEVRIVRDQKTTYLKMARYGEYNDVLPLVLIDHVPVPNIVELLRVPLGRIEKVEILDKPYMVSGVTYNGIISISSKRKDFAGIELHKSSQFFRYDLYSVQPIDYVPPAFESDRQTYRQNLLLWDPQLVLPPGQPKTLSFFTSDSKGEYLVYIRSIHTAGRPHIFGSCKILVE
jgi:hypothetical protein